jgi:hypothetical protein
MNLEMKIWRAARIQDRWKVERLFADSELSVVVAPDDRLAESVPGMPHRTCGLIVLRSL